MNPATPTTEPLETLAPRLIGCMEAVISKLESYGVEVETSSVFLLDFTDWPFRAPRSLDGIPIQVHFVGSFPPWADRVRYHLQVSFGEDPRWSVFEPPNGFNVRRIVTRLLKQLNDHKSECAKRERTEQNRRLAEERIARLGETLGVRQEGPLRLAQHNVELEVMPEAPNIVQVTVRTSHANAEKIIREFRILTGRPKKLEVPCPSRVPTTEGDE